MSGTLKLLLICFVIVMLKRLLVFLYLLMELRTGLYGNFQMMGFGMELREYISAKIATIDGVFAAKEGEATALFYAIEWVHALGFQQVIF